MSLQGAVTHQGEALPRPRLFLALATFSQGAASFTQQGVVVLGVFLAAAYHLSLAEMGLVVSAITLGLMLAGIFMGMLVDRFGSRLVLRTGSIAMCSAAALLGWVHDLPLLCAMLFVLGLTLAVVSTSGSTAVLHAWPPHRRGLPMGIRQTGVTLGAMIAAFTLPSAATAIGLQAIFWGCALLLLFSGLAFSRMIPSTAPGSGAGLSLATARHVAIPMFCGFLLGAGQYDLLTYSIPLLHGEHGLSLAAAGVVLAMSQLGGAIGRIGFGRVSDRFGGRRDAVLAVVAGAATLGALVLSILPHPQPDALLLSLWLCLGIAMVGWNALLLTWVGERVPARQAGTAMSAIGSAVMAGGVVGPPVFGRVVEVTGGYQEGWLTLAGGLFLATLLISVTAVATHRQRPRFPRRVTRPHARTADEGAGEGAAPAR